MPNINLPLRKWVAMLFAASISLLSGCGGGGGGGSGGSGPTSTGTLGGVAAVGTPIVGGTINIICAAGSALASTTTGNTGAWQVTLYGQTLPCAVQVAGGTISSVSNTTPYHSIATTTGTANVTPLSDLMVANLAGTATPSTWFAGLSSSPAPLTTLTQNKVNTALTNLSNALPSLTSLSTVNPITTTFTPTSGNVSDDMLTALATAIANTGVAYTSLLSNASATSFTAPVAVFGTALTTAYASTASGSTPATLSIGGTVTGLTGSVVLQDNGGDNKTVTANGSFTFATNLANGSTYSITVLTQPSGQTCSVSTGTGTVSGGNVTNVAVVCSSNTYNVGGTVSGLSGTLVLQDNNGDNLTITGNGTFTFATKIANSSAYNTTVLTHPANQSCSVASGTGTIALANVNNITITCATNTYTIGGTVAGLNGSMVLQDNGGDNLTVSTNGSFTFPTTVASGSAYNVTVFTQPSSQACSVTSGSGTTTSTVTTVAVNCANTIPPLGKYAYVANSANASVSQYTIGAGGALTPMTPATVATGVSPQSVTVDPSSKYAYVANSADSTISQYTIGVGGALTPMTPATVQVGMQPQTITIDPSGKYAYVAGPNGYVANVYGAVNYISQFTIGAGGVLTPMTPATVAAGTGPYSVTVDPSGQYAYVANQGNISQYTIGAGGALTPMTPATVVTYQTSLSTIVTVGMQPYYVSIDPTGHYAYVADINGAISQFTISTGGALTALTESNLPSFTTTAYSITIAPSGQYAYVIDSLGRVVLFSISAGGALTTPTVIQGGNSVAIDSSGHYAYITNTSSSYIEQYTVGTGGAITYIPPPTVATGTYPTGPIAIAK